MLTKAQLQGLLAEEIRVIRHLASRVPPGGLDYRPSPGQRSTIELLRYLSTAGTDLLRAMLSGVWDVTQVTGKAPHDLPASRFDAAMAAQEAEIERVFAGLTERDLVERKATLPTGETTNLGAAIVAVVLRVL